MITPDGRGWTPDLHTFPIEIRDTTRIRGGEQNSPARDLGNDTLHTPASTDR